MSNVSSGVKRCILYYPTISIPSEHWIKQVILFWDEIGSIVPYRDDEELITYTPGIELLKREGIFRPFRPRMIINRGWKRLKEFEQEFKVIIESENFKKLLQHRKILTFRIHRDKVSSRLFHYLEQKKLAQRVLDDQYGMWYLFENNTALLYMAILAKYLAYEDQEYTIPGTDRSDYEDIIFRALSPEDGVVCLRTNFQEALPVPREDVPLEKIVEFKRNRYTELLHFREEIDAFQKALRECQNEIEVKEITVSFKERIERNVNDLEHLMLDEKIATIPGTLKTIIRLDSPTLWATAGIATGQAAKVADISLAWSIAGTGVLGAIEISKYLLDRRNKQRSLLRDSPFAYLYHARRKKLL